MDAHGERTEAAGGVLSSSAGGGIVATFGAPAAQEDHAERALRVANTLNAKLGGIVPLRVAVESGQVALEKYLLASNDPATDN